MPACAHLERVAAEGHANQNGHEQVGLGPGRRLVVPRGFGSILLQQLNRAQSRHTRGRTQHASLFNTPEARGSGPWQRTVRRSVSEGECVRCEAAQQQSSEHHRGASRARASRELAMHVLGVIIISSTRARQLLKMVVCLVS